MTTQSPPSWTHLDHWSRSRCIPSMYKAPSWAVKKWSTSFIASRCLTSWNTPSSHAWTLWMCMPEQCSGWRAHFLSMEALVIVWLFLSSPTAVLLLHPINIDHYVLACRHHCLSILVRQRPFPELWLHLWLEVMDQDFICGHKLQEDAKPSFFLDKLCWIHFWSDPRRFGTQWADALRQCKALYFPFYNDAARTLAMVSWVVMVTDLPRQLPESPCHVSTQQPTFSPCFIWRDILPCCEHHVLLDLEY